MASVYFHIPFCRRACTYCDFHFSTQLREQGAMVHALSEELNMRAPGWPAGGVLRSIYFGGGTPSVLDPDQVRQLIHAVHHHFEVEPQAEVTLEANPDDLSAPGYLAALREAGVNRLSIGVQSFREEDLQLMNRSHSAEQAHQVLEMAREAGFENLSLDLIYGIPGLDMAAWEQNIAWAVAAAPHISAYALTVEARTALAHQVRKGEVILPEDSTFQVQYFRLIDLLEADGYAHYELSNFARQGFRSRHNSAYWTGSSYLGLGPSAHSFDGTSRLWNVANNARYLRMVQDQQLPIEESELLSRVDRMNEYLMTHLRKAEGVDLDHVRSEWGIDLLVSEGDYLLRCRDQGWLEIDSGHIVLTRAGKMVSDRIISDLFVVED